MIYIKCFSYRHLAISDTGPSLADYYVNFLRMCRLVVAETKAWQRQAVVF